MRAHNHSLYIHDIDIDTLSWLRTAPPHEESLATYRHILSQHSALPREFATIPRLGAYLMLTKNAFTLYREGLFNTADIQQLRKLIALQIEVSTATLAQTIPPPTYACQTLSKLINAAASAGELILSMTQEQPAFGRLMNDYHAGTGFHAYRYAQRQRIVQVWATRKRGRGES
ncbi:hypothetical protein [Lelliottia amnigena]|uniref:hypothetical protein n=1 Tax=Lelliottia amnigena TaxID=61646 RepID=UPI004057430E